MIVKESEVRKVVRDVLSEATYGLQDLVNWDRKATEWDRVIETTAREGSTLADALDDLPVYTMETAKIMHDHNPIQTYMDPEELPNKFLYRAPEGLYVINREGYDYPRYLSRIVGDYEIKGSNIVESLDEVAGGPWQNIREMLRLGSEQGLVQDIGTKTDGGDKVHEFSVTGRVFQIKELG